MARKLSNLFQFIKENNAKNIKENKDSYKRRGNKIKVSFIYIHEYYYMKIEKKNTLTLFDKIFQKSLVSVAL